MRARMAAAPDNVAPPPYPRMGAQAFQQKAAPAACLSDCSGPLCTRLTERGGFMCIGARGRGAERQREHAS